MATLCGCVSSTHALHALSQVIYWMASLRSLWLIALVVRLPDTVSTSATRHDPGPNPEAVVQVGKARFTVLTEHLVRMEWGGANDAATFAFVNRNLPTPNFTTTKDGNWTVIQTSAVMVL